MGKLDLEPHGDVQDFDRGNPLWHLAAFLDLPLAWPLNKGRAGSPPTQGRSPQTREAALRLGTLSCQAKSKPALYHPPGGPSRTTRRWSDRTNLQNNG